MSDDPGRGAGARWRFGLWLALLLGWVAALPFAWRAFATVPSPERLSRSHLVAIPTLRTFAVQVGTGALELAILLLLLWPGRARLWLLRLWLAGLGLLLYFLATPPLGLTALGLVHRRWLFATALGLIICAIAATAAALLRGRPHAAGGS